MGGKGKAWAAPLAAILLLSGGAADAAPANTAGLAPAGAKGHPFASAGTFRTAYRAHPWKALKPPDPGQTSRHLPATLEIDGQNQLRLFRALVAGARIDSTRHWELRDGLLRISHDLLEDLSGGNLPITGGGPGSRLAAYLSRVNGVEYRASGSAYGTYLPDDPALAGNEPGLPGVPQWALKNTGTAFDGRPGKAGKDIDIERVWDKFAGGDSLIIAVLDAGFDFRHPDLKGRNWINRAEADGVPGVDDDHNGYVDDSVGWDFVENDNLSQDYHGHGTLVSSVIAGGFDDHQGMAGMLARGKIMPVRVLDASGHGDESRIAKGILYAIKNGAKVINFSIGGEGDNPTLRAAFQAARDSGVAVVVAAGNDAQDINAHAAYPASYAYENMVVVAAHDHAGLLCGFSNFGKTLVHLAAPGEFILAADIPPPKEIWLDDFETAKPGWTADGGFAYASANALDGLRYLAWVSGNNAVAMPADTFDLRGVKGATLNFVLDFKAAQASDMLIVEGNKIGTAQWTEIAVIGGTVPIQYQKYGLQDMDGSLFRIRFRTSLATRYSSATRLLRIDDVSMAVPDTVQPKQPVFAAVAGTSLAAPHVSAYVGLQRLACERMGLAWSRARALEGVAPESSLAGKVSSNGRLDVYKGLEFYLSTLPDFRIEDSNAVSWKVGDKVSYALRLSPAPAEPYAFSLSGLPAGAAIDGAGVLAWTPKSDEAGEYALRLKAEGPAVLRKLFTFKVEKKSEPVAVQGTGSPAQAGVWRIGGQVFRLRPDLAQGRHFVEVFGTDAAGKVQILKRGWMESRGGWETGVFTAVGRGRTAWAALRLQVRVDGIYLASGA